MSSEAKRLSDFFFSRSWTWVQRMDSDIAENVMLRLLDHQITVLPIHDSFIVRIGEEAILKIVMEEAFAEIVGTATKIKRDDTIFDNLPIPSARHAWGRDVMGEAKLGMKSNRQYHLRELQWQKKWGPL